MRDGAGNALVVHRRAPADFRAARNFREQRHNARAGGHFKASVSFDEIAKYAFEANGNGAMKPKLMGFLFAKPQFCTKGCGPETL